MAIQAGHYVHSSQRQGSVFYSIPLSCSLWRKNENTSSFDRLVKGALLTVEGYFKPEEWQDAEGVKHNRVILVATKFYEAVEKENTPDSQQGKIQKDK